MPARLPDDISREDILSAIKTIDSDKEHPFADSVEYDVLYEGVRYPPKAVIGLAAERRTGKKFHPRDFRGGKDTKCFRLLLREGFVVVPKAETEVFPNELGRGELYIEGARETVVVNRYERDSKARQEAIQYHGTKCQVCSFDFEANYGEIGRGFIHVHHIVPQSEIDKEYSLDPVADLTPVCPNCHAMLHQKSPPYSIEELREIVRRMLSQK